MLDPHQRAVSTRRAAGLWYLPLSITINLLFTVIMRRLFSKLYQWIKPDHDGQLSEEEITLPETRIPTAAEAHLD